MSRALLAIALFLNSAACVVAQDIPVVLRGTWRVQRMLPADTVSCWGEKQARGLIGTRIEYTADSFRWKDKLISHPGVKVAVVTADQFQEEYSGSGSFVDFARLGIRGSQATQIQIDHPAADITGGSIEIPGDDILIKDRNTIVFSACNVYFEAKRESAQKKTVRH
ncbi:MAG: hypothetical protein ABSA42_17910 [Terracidiphilus sp.]|jgi:hypothetical protein